MEKEERKSLPVSAKIPKVLIKLRVEIEKMELKESALCAQCTARALCAQWSLILFKLSILITKFN